MIWWAGEPSKLYLSVTSAGFGEGLNDKSPDFGLFFVQLVREGVPLGPFLVCFFSKFWSVFGLILDIFSPDF